jgi:hypothetical protein
MQKHSLAMWEGRSPDPNLNTTQARFEWRKLWIENDAARAAKRDPKRHVSKSVSAPSKHPTRNQKYRKENRK